jgi:hypothetical protein
MYIINGFRDLAHSVARNLRSRGSEYLRVSLDPRSFRLGFGDQARARNTRSMPSRSCVFCGASSNLTKEHVYPKWLRRALGTDVPVWIVRNRGGVDEVIRPATPFDVTLREVCRDCNNGWLHELEATFRAVMLPALQDKTSPVTVLDSESQQVVAAWALKTWLLADLSR